MNYSTLGKIATYINGKAFKPEDWSSKGKPIIRIQNLTDPNKPFNYFNKLCDKRYHVKDGDILISWSASLGIYEWQGTDAYLNQHIFKVELDEAKIHKGYFKHIVSEILTKVDNHIHGSTMKHITKGRFDALPIPLPDLQTQEKIADVLDKADAIRRRNKEILQKYDDLAQSIFLEMFGDPVKNEKGWELVKLKEIGKWRSGGTPSRGNKEFFNGHIPWLSSGELNAIFCNTSNEYITDEAVLKSSASIIEPYSLLLGMYDTAALKSTINTIECACNQAIAFAKIDSFKANIIFVYFMIQIGKNYFKRLQRGVRQKNMNLGMIKSMDIILPDITLQNKFAKTIERIETQKQKHQQEINKSEALFQSLLQRAFKGELFEIESYRANPMKEMSI